MSKDNKDLMKYFHQVTSRYGMIHNIDEIFEYLHTFPEEQDYTQLSLFD